MEWGELPRPQDNSEEVIYDVSWNKLIVLFFKLYYAALKWWRTSLDRWEAPNPWEKEPPMTYEVQCGLDCMTNFNVHLFGAGVAGLPVEAAGHASGRRDGGPTTPRNNAAALDNHLWTVYAGRPWGTLAAVPAPEVGSIPGREIPSYGEMESDGPGLLDARCLPVVLCAQDDVGAP